MRTQIRTMLEEHESAREELKSSEEELLSSNEEFQSTNEELETAKEELQSLNEELSTTNDELRYRNHELRLIHDDVALSRDYADAIIDTMAEPLLVLESDLRVTRANHAFYQTFRTTAENTIGALLYVLGNGQWNIPALRDLLERLLPERTVVRDFQITHDFPNIGTRTMRVNGARVLGRTNERILLTVEDITDHQLSVQRLEDADHQKDDFLAMLAHELRNPLAAISNAIEVWGRANVAPETQQRARTVARRQLDREIRLVDDLLDVSRITRGIIKLDFRPVNFAETVQHSVAAMRAEIDARQHNVTVVLPPQVLAVEGDAIRLEQIVTNLLGNAVKYTPPNGRIEITLVRDGEQAVLTVVDNGVGMSAEFLPTIFTPFVQAERSLARTAAGLGLGLALVQKLVGLHNGTVDASSAGPGQGSSFVVRLPAPARMTAPEPSTTEPGFDAPGISAQKILVVDDNTDAAESTAMVLKLEGHEVKVASNGPAALQYATDFRPDVILLDIGLPEMDGYEIARRLRAIASFTQTLLIAVSGYAGDEHRERARQAGFDHYLVKPAGVASLNQLIASFRSAGQIPH